MTFHDVYPSTLRITWWFYLYEIKNREVRPLIQKPKKHFSDDLLSEKLTGDWRFVIPQTKNKNCIHHQTVLILNRYLRLGNNTAVLPYLSLLPSNNILQSFFLYVWHPHHIETASHLKHMYRSMYVIVPL